MGDRANIALEFEDNERIYLYTHWEGSNLPNVLRSALQRGKPRWQDPSYLSRIIFSEMIQRQVLEETGFGIAPYPTDNEWPFLVVNLERNEVYTEDDKRDGHDYRNGPSGSWTFEEFIALTHDPRRGVPE